MIIVLYLENLIDKFETVKEVESWLQETDMPLEELEFYEAKELKPIITLELVSYKVSTKKKAGKKVKK